MNRFESRLNNIQGTRFHGPIIDVMDTFETVCLGLDVICPGQWDASAAAKLTELILIQSSLDGAPL
jgi:hypothetical protein